jgi:hypothetical protein
MNFDYGIGNELLQNIALPGLYVLVFVRRDILDRRKRSSSLRWQPL